MVSSGSGCFGVILGALCPSKSGLMNKHIVKHIVELVSSAHVSSRNQFDVFSRVEGIAMMFQCPLVHARKIFQVINEVLLPNAQRLSSPFYFSRYMCRYKRRNGYFTT